MPITRFCLVRHGETDWNAERRLQGQIDIPLNRHGHEQAACLAHAMQHSGQRFDALYSSDLQRASATAAPLASRLGLTPVLLPALRERHFGALQGVRLDDAANQQPAAWQGYAERQVDHDLDGGESLQVFAARVHETLARLAADHHGACLLLVAHGGVLDMAYRLASGQSLASQRAVPIPNAALNWLSLHNGRWQVDEWANEQHLPHTLDEL